MPKRLHSSLILAIVFVLGIAGGVAGMVWAWPGLRARYFHRQHQTFIEYMQKSLDLTPGQVPQIEAIFKETSEQRHAIHLQFAPQYYAACEQYMQIRAQERAAFDPLGQQSLDKMKAVLTPAQWATFQKQRPPQRPLRDTCQHPEQGPGGGGPGGGGRSGRGGRRGGPPTP